MTNVIDLNSCRPANTVRNRILRGEYTGLSTETDEQIDAKVDRFVFDLQCESDMIGDPHAEIILESALEVRGEENEDQVTLYLGVYDEYRALVTFKNSLKLFYPNIVITRILMHVYDSSGIVLSNIA